MTTQQAAEQYLREHVEQMGGRAVAVYNPNNSKVIDLPVIYGFNNGGSEGFYSAVLMAEDGTFLGSHLCSHEAYMHHDLGILEGTRPDRHETFREHYPNGYRMAFVTYSDVLLHNGLLEAFRLNTEKEKEDLKRI